MDEDKRNAVRITKNIAVDYSYDDRAWIDTCLHDISEKGICITTHQASVPDQNIIIHVQLPQRKSRWVELPGKVIASEKISDDVFRTRIEFLNLTTEQIKLLRIFVAEALVKGG